MTLEFAYPTDLEWIEERARVTLTRKARGLLAVDERGRIRGATAYDRWTPNSCEMHVALDTPLAIRALLPEAFQFPFVHGGKGVVYAIIQAGNERSLRLCEAFGFTRTGAVASGYLPGVDGVLMQLRREDCRHLKEKH